MQETLKASSMEKIMENYKSSMIFSHKRFVTKNSKIPVEIGALTCWDYLNGYLSYVNITEKNRVFGDSNLAITMVCNIMNIMKAIYIPKNGKYIKVTKPDQMFSLLQTFDVHDIEELYQLALHHTAASKPYFETKEYVCPHCGRTSPCEIDVKNDLIFARGLALASNRISLTEEIMI
jgi:hypothetical protein